MNDICEAIVAGNVEEVKKIIDGGVDVDGTHVVDGEEKPLLIHAIDSGNKEIVEAFIEAGVDVSFEFKDKSPAEYADDIDRELILCLVEAGSSFNPNNTVDFYEFAEPELVLSLVEQNVLEPEEAFIFRLKAYASTDDELYNLLYKSDNDEVFNLSRQVGVDVYEAVVNLGCERVFKEMVFSNYPVSDDYNLFEELRDNPHFSKIFISYADIDNVSQCVESFLCNSEIGGDNEALEKVLVQCSKKYDDFINFAEQLNELLDNNDLSHKALLLDVALNAEIIQNSDVGDFLEKVVDVHTFDDDNILRDYLVEKFDEKSLVEFSAKNPYLLNVLDHLATEGKVLLACKESIQDMVGDDDRTIDLKNSLNSFVRQEALLHKIQESNKLKEEVEQPRKTAKRKV